MNKDEIAVYLNEHPEFFNDYPELLQQIRAIELSDLPLEPLKTLSIADRIIKRATADKEHLRSRLEWFLEIAQANEWILEHLNEIERLVFSCTMFPQMIRSFCEEMSRRFDIRYVQVCLVDGEDHFIERGLRERFGTDGLSEFLFFSDQETVSGWFGGGDKTVLRGELPEGSGFFSRAEARAEVRSEALVPIILYGRGPAGAGFVAPENLAASASGAVQRGGAIPRGRIAGVIGMGSQREFHFYPGLRTDYLERLADKIGLAIDNLCLLEQLKIRPALDRDTGFYNAEFLETILMREFERAQRFELPLSCIKVHIDGYDEILKNHGKSKAARVIKSAGSILREGSRAGDVLFRAEKDEFLLLLSGIDGEIALRVAERIRSALEAHRFSNGMSEMSVTASIGVAAFPGEMIQQYCDLLRAASEGLERAIALGRNRVCRP